jgi:hypothetical protein
VDASDTKERRRIVGLHLRRIALRLPSGAAFQSRRDIPHQRRAVADRAGRLGEPHGGAGHRNGTRQAGRRDGRVGWTETGLSVLRSSELVREPVCTLMTPEEMREMFDEIGETLRIKRSIRDGIEWHLGDAGAVDERVRYREETRLPPVRFRTTPEHLRQITNAKRTYSHERRTWFRSRPSTNCRPPPPL